MTILVARRSPRLAGSNKAADPVAINVEMQVSTPWKRRFLPDTSLTDSLNSSAPLPMQSSPTKWKSPRRRLTDSPNSPSKGIGEIDEKAIKMSKSPVKKRLFESFVEKPLWNPRDTQQRNAVKEALHVSTAPSTIVCRDVEQNRVLEFCKRCVEQEKAGSLYVCGCPGTGKSLSMEKVKEALIDWAKKILENIQPKKKLSNSTAPLQLLQNLFSQKQQAGSSMMLIIADELDYLIAKDRAVLHDLFMLTTFPFSRCIILGIANAIDLVDRFLPKLQSLNCKPVVITFHAYSKDQILMILRQRLAALLCTVFQPQALELCARKIATASGDMRKALSICRVDHVARALSNAYKSPAVDIIQSLPQHQQLSNYYMDVCRSTSIPAVGIMELSSMCRVLADQGLLKMGQSREVKSRRVTLKVDEADITFALQGIRFRNYLQ